VALRRAGFGASGAGIRQVETQSEQGDAYRSFVEGRASKPWSVGSHYLQYYDQSVAGRYDGENFNIGLFDVCNQPYRSLTRATRESNRRIYSVVDGSESPTSAEYRTVD
jgi:hypothetical protein